MTEETIDMLQNVTKDEADSKTMATNGQGNPQIAKLLKLKIKTGDTDLMLITPATATEMLAYNENNRPLSQHNVKKYAAQMSAGEWRLTRQPIIFSESGRLQDGQTRLSAVVESGKATQFYVAFGDPDENFAFIDIGKPRGPADIFAINGVINYACAASMSKWVYAYDNAVIVRGAGTGLGGAATPFGGYKLYEFYLTLRRPQDSIHAVQSFADSRVVPMSLAAALHYICARKAREQADSFFVRVGAGTDLKAKTPAHRLRARLIQNLASTDKLPPVVLAAYIIKAWNAERANRPIQQFKWRGEGAPDETFPKAI